VEKGRLSHLKMTAFTQALDSSFILQTDRHSWRKEKVIQVELSLDAAQTEIVMKEQQRKVTLHESNFFPSVQTTPLG